MKNSQKKLKKVILSCIIIIGLLMVLLILLRMLYHPPKEENEMTTEKKEEQVTDYVRNRREKERMQVYLAEYLKHIERREYDEAYALLYPQFKQNYFPTEKLYIQYIENHYSELMSVEYSNMERQGNYYIITALITNMEAVETQKSQKFILYENGLNDYVLSFQVE